MTTIPQLDTIHPFERAGMGKAPYRFIGLDYSVGPIRSNDGMTTIGSPGQPMGTCEYCGQGIAYICRIQSADGQVFKVGCDCVKKLNREDNTATLIDQVAGAKRKLDQDRKHAAEDRRVAEGREYIESRREVLAAYPHPHQYWAEKGQTAADAYDWMMSHAGRSGQLRAIAAARRLLDD